MTTDQEVKKVLGYAVSLPSTAPGHGSRNGRKKCIVPGCSGKTGHKQNRIKVALAELKHQGFQPGPMALSILKELAK